jgi:hypothetical protein
MQPIGRRRWAIAEGFPSQSSFADPLFADREPVGPYRVTIAPRRTLHLRFNDLKEPAPVPRDTDFSSVFEANAPIVVQHTRLDSRHAEISLLSTTAYAEA